MDNNFVQQKLGCARIEVVFEFVCPKPTLTIYRGVKATDGGYRMEKRRSIAKRFRPIMWSGGKDSVGADEWRLKKLTEIAIEANVSES